MTLIKRNTPVINSFADFFDDSWLNKNDFYETVLPAVNVNETDKLYEIELAVPGYKKDEFNVEVENNVLKITAESTIEEEEKKKNYTRKEFSSKSFKRLFTLPEDANQDSVEAEYKDGLLKVQLKKTNEKKNDKKRISIK